MKIVVIGGSGLIGKRVVENLRQRPTAPRDVRHPRLEVADLFVRRFDLETTDKKTTT
jgi:uncharacterized protein YbjT (DUF2867 family)